MAAGAAIGAGAPARGRAAVASAARPVRRIRVAAARASPRAPSPAARHASAAGSGGAPPGSPRAKADRGPPRRGWMSARASEAYRASFFRGQTTTVAAGRGMPSGPRSPDVAGLSAPASDAYLSSFQVVTPLLHPHQQRAERAASAHAEAVSALHEARRALRSEPRSATRLEAALARVGTVRDLSADCCSMGDAQGLGDKLTAAYRQLLVALFQEDLRRTDKCR